MYPNVHATAGVICTLGIYAITKDTLSAGILGGILAFYSHDLFDRLGETGYRTMKQFLLIESPPLILFIVLGYFSDLTWLYLIGWVGGNCMDLIDKKLGLSIINPVKYPATFLFKAHNRLPDINLNLRQTIILCYLASLLLIGLFLIELRFKI